MFLQYLTWHLGFQSSVLDKTNNIFHVVFFLNTERTGHFENMKKKKMTSWYFDEESRNIVVRIATEHSGFLRVFFPSYISRTDLFLKTPLSH